MWGSNDMEGDAGNHKRNQKEGLSYFIVELFGLYENAPQIQYVIRPNKALDNNKVT